MFKLGDRVRCTRLSRWYNDVGPSIGTIVAISDFSEACRVMFRYEDFVNDDYDFNRLHDCRSEIDSFQFLEEYFEYDEYSDDCYCLREEYKGYQIEEAGLELVQYKKGNEKLFRGY